MRYPFLCIICLLIITICPAQEGNRQHLGIYDNLPSNHVYRTLTDHHGYLWIATDNGVAKYNGYELKNIDLSKGIINKDIWNLCEDKKGRIWLSSISDKLGYIYNDQYHNLIAPGADFFYPFSMQDYGEGICFNSLTHPFPSSWSIGVERNDSLLYTYDQIPWGVFVANTGAGELITLDTNGNISYIAISAQKAEVKKRSKLYTGDNSPGKQMMTAIHNPRIAFGHYILSYKQGDDFFWALNVDSVNCQKKKLADITKSTIPEYVKLITSPGKNMMVVTDQFIYELDSNLNLAGRIPVSFLSKQENISWLTDEPFWGQVFSTTTNGMYIAYGNDNLFKKVSSLDLVNYLYAGSTADGTGYWYNKIAGIKAKVIKNKEATYSQYSTRINPLIISCYQKYYALYHKLKQKAVGAPADTLRLFFDDKYAFYDVSDAIPASQQELYATSKFFGFYKLKQEHGYTTLTRIDQDRFDQLLYDSLRHTYITYNYRKILLYQEGKPAKTINRKQLESRGINGIKKMLVDNKYGNIFLQEEKRLLLFADIDKPYRELFNNIILDNVKVQLRNDVLVVAGVFGVLYCKVTGPGTISKPVVYPNTKNLNYSIVHDFQISDNKVLLNTDEGCYLIKMPDDTEYEGQAGDQLQPFKLITFYKDQLFDIKQKDTISVTQEDNKFLFDVINPTGNGQVKYAYRIAGRDTSWHSLNTNELDLLPLAAGNYYTLLLIASDNQWRSPAISIHLYIIPYWWQRPIARKLIWGIALISVLAFIYLVIVITQRIVTRKNIRKNLRIELELKSVYSQINPHFIFNSLNAAMYLVKMKKFDEAYQHIYKFSHLLRAYIRSSRNRFITLRQEIKNLQDYMDLQQARFQDKFDYAITVAPAINMESNLPSLLLQPLVENAITHGFLQKTGRGHLKIGFDAGNAPNEMICIIEDDGIGRKLAMAINEQNTTKRESYGSQLTKDLIATFNKYEKMKIDIQYIDKELPLTGTIVKLSIKYTDK